MSDLNQVMRSSVTADDYNNGVIRFMLPFSSFGSEGALPAAPPEYWSFARDKVLLSTITAESMWSSAVAIACTKMASAAWEIESDIPLRVKNGQELLLMADMQRGWTTFITKHLQNYLLTDNGAFIEIVRATSAIGSKIIGLVHLDSTRCMRTGDPEKPVVYNDRQNKLHELRSHEVITLSDMPDARELFFGVGHCAASRAYPQIIKMASIETYIYEKVTGRKIKEVHFISGVNEKQVQNFVKAAESQADAKGLVAYMGAVIVPVPGDKAPETAMIPLAQFPDGFNRKEEFDIAVLNYADAIGLDVQDLQPLTGRALGTAMQSEVLSDKATGKGQAAWRSGFIHAMNNWVLPDMTTMIFIEKDWRDKQAQATYNKTVNEYTAAAVAGGMLTPQQGLQSLVDENVYPKEFLPEDITPDTSLADSEKPETEVVDQPEEVPPETPEVITPLVKGYNDLNVRLKKVENVTAPIVKDYIDDLLEETREEAIKLAEKISGKRKI